MLFEVAPLTIPGTGGADLWELRRNHNGTTGNPNDASVEVLLGGVVQPALSRRSTISQPQYVFNGLGGADALTVNFAFGGTFGRRQSLSTATTRQPARRTTSSTSPAAPSLPC